MAKKQPTLPGTTPDAIKELDNATAEYLAARNERMRLLKIEVEKKAALVGQMHDFEPKLEQNIDGDPVYHYRDGDESFVVVLAAAESLKVKRDDEVPGDIG